MDTPVAVAVFHGIGSQKPDYAEQMIGDLTRRVAKMAAKTAHVRPHFICKAIHWADVLREHERKLCNDERIPGHLGWRALRRLLVAWLGDAVAYEPTTRSRTVYDEVHARVASQLRELAEESGNEAPLCVVAHSFGSVIANNYFHDLQSLSGVRPCDSTALAACERVLASVEDSPLAAGETLATMITLGSPLATLNMRCPNAGAPIQLPGSRVLTRFPQVEGVWLNFIGVNDVLAGPLGTLSPAYFSLVADIPVRLNGLLTGWNPLSHFRYWNDEYVLESIAAAIVDLWRDANVSGQ